MRILRTLAPILLVLPLSTIVVACGGDEDSDARAALEREALERELDLALQPDTTAEPEFADVPLEEAEPSLPPVTQAPAPTPAPARRSATPAREPAPRRVDPTPAPTPEPQRPRTVTRSAPSGTTFAVRLNQELSTRTASPGQTFTATLSEPIVAADGTTLIPAGATLRGRVTESKKSGSAGDQAQLRIDFTSVTYAGETYSIDATTLDAEAKLVTRDSKASQAAKVGGGAVLGGVLGRVLGKDTKSTVAGAAIGAAAGTAVAMGTADVDAVIPAGARVTVRLDTPIRVTQEVG